jgi:hypothetical protein
MKTAVEWLHEQFKAGFNYNIEEGYEKRRDELFEEAKEMEREQTIKGILDNRNITSQVTYLDAAEYFDRTFKQEP